MPAFGRRRQAATAVDGKITQARINYRWLFYWENQHPDLEPAAAPVHKHVSIVLSHLQRQVFGAPRDLPGLYQLVVWWWWYKAPRIRLKNAVPYISPTPTPLWGCLEEFRRWMERHAVHLGELQTQVPVLPEWHRAPEFVALEHACYLDTQAEEEGAVWKVPDHWIS